MSKVSEFFDAEADVLRETFYKSEPAPKPRRAAPRKRKRKPKPTHYQVICISLYEEDLRRLDDKVSALKAKGHRKMSRSALIRYALDTADLEGLPRSY